LGLFFNHTKVLFVILLFVIFFLNPAVSKSVSSFLIKEVLVFVVDLGIILALAATHILLFLVTLWELIIHLGVSELTVIALVTTHVGRAEHAHAAFKISIVFFSTHRPLTGLLNLAYTGAVMAA
jgi:hypothetical protein